MLIYSHKARVTSETMDLNNDNCVDIDPFPWLNTSPLDPGSIYFAALILGDRRMGLILCEEP